MTSIAPQQQLVTFYDAEGDGRGRLVVKHTFLDFVEDGEEQDQPMFPQRSRTDPMFWRGSIGTRLEVYHPGSSTDVTPDGSDEEEQDEEAREDDEEVLAPARSAARATSNMSPKQEQHPQQRPQQQQPQQRTTMMMRNLPNDYTREMLLRMLDTEGFHGYYDFVYLPMDFARGCGLGYAFVNLVDEAWVEKFQKAFDGYTRWSLRTSKVCQVSWSDRDHGLKNNVKRYRNSPVMHPSVPDEFKPCIFSDGARLPFPEPTKDLRRPSKASKK